MATLLQKDLKILYWNPRSILTKKEELTKLLIDIDIFVCVESWLSEQAFHCSGFKTFRKDRSYAIGGGILILIRNNLAFVEITNIKCPDDRVELAGIKITNVQPTIDVTVCYRAPGPSLSQTQWDQIFDNIDTKNHDFRFRSRV